MQLAILLLGLDRDAAEESAVVGSTESATQRAFRRVGRIRFVEDLCERFVGQAAQAVDCRNLLGPAPPRLSEKVTMLRVALNSVTFCSEA